MGEAKRRGSYEERKMQAIIDAEIKKENRRIAIEEARWQEIKKPTTVKPKHKALSTILMAQALGVQSFMLENKDVNFPKPSRKDGKEPCGECHLPPNEICDICGAKGR